MNRADHVIRDFSCGENENIVKTKAGLLRGYRQNEVYEFKGVRYAEAKRFQMPEPVTPWEGVKEALDYGFLCPATPETTMEGNLAFPKRYWFWDENCQYLNIWTKWLNDTTAKKPVMVWLHGGGYSSGSSIELECYDGENMCRYGDVVQISLNHRLNIYGFLDLSDFGPEYELSGIVGMEDVVMALRWIHDNIEQFGGDPDNVIIFGQSGGGCKVRALLQMGSAEGLFSKAICMSGVIGPEDSGGTPADEKEEARAMGRAYVEEAGGLDKLLAMNDRELLALIQKLSGTGFVPWAPVPCTGSYIGQWSNAGFREGGLKIPMIVGSVIPELIPRSTDLRDKSTLSEEERYAEVVSTYGEEGAPLVAAEWKKAYPEFNLFHAARIDNRQASVQYCVERVRNGGTCTYNFVFAHESWYKGGLLSTHADDLFFVFHNAEYFGSQYGGEVTWQLEEQIFQSYMNFARTGDPNCAEIPEWKAVKADEENCFVFSKASGNRVAHDRELMKYVKKYTKYGMPFFEKKTFLKK